jgi:glycerophosphoryl diester phosphodiesterase
MQIIAHRGWWLRPDQKNSRAAFEKALAAGYGIETDIRDCDGALVVSHDMPRSAAEPDGQMPIDSFLDLYCSYSSRPILALNIKAAGLAGPLKAALDRRGISRYFVFDMSVPDTLAYLQADMTTFTRRSEFEPGSKLDSCAHGLWLDAFEAPYVTPIEISNGVASGRPVAIVSPELHGKPYIDAWQAWRTMYIRMPVAQQMLVMICTDFPSEADAYFNSASD